MGKRACRAKDELDRAKAVHVKAKARFKEVIEICLMRGWVNDLAAGMGAEKR